MKTIRLAMALLGAAAFLAASPKADALTLSFVNNSAVSGSNVWITFGGANNSTLSGTLTYSGTQQAITFGASYNLAQISGSIALLNANAGKIFVSYGAGLSNASAVGNPDFQYLSGDPTAQVRWDKIEYTLFSNTTQGQSAVNMSAADFYSIPMQVTTSLSGAATGTLGWHPQTSTSTVFYNLGSLATGSTQPYAVVTATTTTGSNFSVQATFSGTTLNVLRIINPNNVNLNVTNPYPSLLPYAMFTSTVGGTGTSANISSYYVGAGTTSNGLPASAWAAQNYSFTSSVASSGNMVISGSGSAVGAQTITIQAADLGVGLYSNAPNYYLSSFGGGTTPLQNSNCVYDAIISDVLAAYNMGLVGSTTIDPRFSGSNIVVGGEPSGQWYSVGGTPYATNPKLAPEQLFSFMQPNSPAGTPFYNPFAAYLAPITDAYGFPYTDKTASPQLNITPGAADAMVITILPDIAPVSGLDSPRPAALPKAIRDDWTTYSYLKIKGEGKSNSGSILLHLRINHPDISELTVRLVSPWGKSFLIHDRTGAGADLVIPGVALSAGKRNILANGLWTLVVRDAKKGNKGTIVDWGLQFP